MYTPLYDLEAGKPIPTPHSSILAGRSTRSLWIIAAALGFAAVCVLTAVFVGRYAFLRSHTAGPCGGSDACIQQGDVTDMSFTIIVPNATGTGTTIVVHITEECFSLTSQAPPEFIQACNISAVVSVKRTTVNETSEFTVQRNATAESMRGQKAIIETVSASPLWDALPSVSAAAASTGAIHPVSQSGAVGLLHHFAALHGRMSNRSHLSKHQVDAANRGAEKAVQNAARRSSKLDTPVAPNVPVPNGGTINALSAVSPASSPTDISMNSTRVPYKTCDNKCVGMCGVGGAESCDCWTWTCPVLRWNGNVPSLDRHASCGCNLGCFLHDMRTSCAAAKLAALSLPPWLAEFLQGANLVVTGGLSAPLIAAMLVASGRHWCDACPVVAGLPPGENQFF
jgi:hypothetical protein